MKKLLNRKFILVLLVIFFASAAAALAVPDKLKPGTKAPGFSLKDVKTGENVNLSDFKDKKIVIVHFWKSKWRDCLEELPHLMKLQEKYKDDVQVLTVNPINPTGRIKAEIARFNVDFPVLTGRGSRIVIDYDVRGLPKIVIIDKQGLVVKSAGYLPDDELQKIVSGLIVKDKPADK